MKNQLISTRLNPNAGIMAWYVKELKKLTKSMTSECENVLTRIYKNLDYQIEFDTANPPLEGGSESLIPEWGKNTIAQDDSISSQFRMALNKLYNKFYDKFSARSKDLIKKLLKDTNKYSVNQFNIALKGMLGEQAKDFMLKGSAISPEKSEVMKALIFENVSLIRSIHNEYFKQITGAVARSIENGTGLKGLKEELLRYGAKSERRADLIAQDQTRKAYTSINLRNFQENGVRKFKWVHTGGSRDPREYHRDVLNGNVYDIYTGAPNESGREPEYIYPGQEPYCRCIMQAVLDFED